MLVVSAVRSTGAFSGRLMPALAIASSTVATSSFSTSTASRSSSKVTCVPHPLFATKTAAPSPFLGFMSSRSASTAVPPSSSPSQSPTTQQLTWNRFLELRRTRRKISVAASSLSAVATTYTGLNVFISGGYDASLSATLGLDPIVTAGLSTVTLLAIGWLVGPFFGNAAFNARYRGIRGEIEAKERAFYSRIKAHRVDPTSSSMANPVPDYYGEKIGSVADYRRWLKDQRAFNLKRGAYQGNK